MNKPPANIAAFAAAYQCADCDSETELVPDPLLPGLWRLKVMHDEGCPVLNGRVSKVDAAQAAAEQTPGRTLYLSGRRDEPQ